MVVTQFLSSFIDTQALEIYLSTVIRHFFNVLYPEDWLREGEDLSL